MSAPDITFDPEIKFKSHQQIVLSGTVSGNNVDAVEVYDADGTTALGPATVKNGKWSFTESLDPDGQFHGFSATAYGGSSMPSVTSASSVIDGVTGRPYSAVVDTFASDTGRLSMEFHAADGSLEAHGAYQADPGSGGSVFVETGDAAKTRFVFDDTTVDQRITNFHATGSSHDVLLLPHADFANLADVIRNTTMSHGAATIHDPNSGTSITLTGVTKTELKAHAQDFSFHGPGSFLPA